jgi:cell division protein FtsI/penicillin-binding protein 2
LGQNRFDEPLIFSDGSQKKSWKNLGNVSDTEALKFSSNIFFMKQTIEMSGQTFVNRGKLLVDLGLFDYYRSYFAQFGLGVGTGLDLPSESEGFMIKDKDKTAAKLLDYVIGQADMYTVMQLAQYVSTLANFGSRYAPHVVNNIYIPAAEGEGMQLLAEIEPKLINRVEMGWEYFDQVRKGFKRALQESGGTGYEVFRTALDMNPAGKTGTAEEFARGADGFVLRDGNGDLTKVHNTTFIGYAPLNDPEIAIAIILPQAELPDKSNPTAQIIARDAMQAYFEIQKSR